MSDSIDALDRLIKGAIVGEVADDDEVDLVAVLRVCMYEGLGRPGWMKADPGTHTSQAMRLPALDGGRFRGLHGKLCQLDNQL